MDVGHVDKIIGFHVINSRMVLVATDATKSQEILLKAQQHSFSSKRVAETGRETIDEFLADKNATEASEADETVARSASQSPAPAPPRRPGRSRGSEPLSHLYIRVKTVHANSVNGLSLSPPNYMASNILGPVIRGLDVLQLNVDHILRNAGFSRVDYVDADGFHEYDGDLHCLANTWHDASEPWWRSR
ncbi:uncharacterized protein MAM_07615 [Metarhizium album ARSEF 1941]|uniref:Protein-arginine deiminase C-terminal domain-containing protein n=1 Tax=Metarhizium album (strain ARSEF 1941) TaxID=1081103 RepID=A0A0B2WNI0_METAS|nr:uncharacterized protein MAM_07615 [Metarhizium album ARSEF 1941]KHN94560.1 hypothetical protein MAM_07615 [Metarhizium album ARSEF 1941]